MKKQIALAAILAAGFLGLRAQDADAVTLIKQAADAVRRADFAQADVLYAKAAAQGDRPELAPALWYLGARAAGMGNRLAAEGFFDRLLKLDPNSQNAARALTWLANMRRLDPAGAGAESMFKQALAIEEAGGFDTTETARSYGVLLRHHDRLAEAEAMEQRARAVRTASAQKSLSAPLPQGVYKVGGGITAPSLISKVEPQYTEEARATKIQGTTIVSVDVGPDGVARNFEIVRSLEPGLDLKAIAAIQQWLFKPGMKDGAPVTVRATIEVNFRLM